MNDPTAVSSDFSPSEDMRYLCALLRCDHIPGTKEEIARLRVRVDELKQMNGRQWVRDNAGHLLAQWRLAMKLDS